MIEGFEADPRAWDEIETIVRQEIYIDGAQGGNELFFEYMRGLWDLLHDQTQRTRMLAHQAHKLPDQLEDDLANIETAKADIEQQIRDRPVDPGEPVPARSR